MKKFLIPALVSFMLIACSKDDGGENNSNSTQNQNPITDVNCANAQVEVCNNTSDQAVYFGWNTNQIEDTLFPGDCQILDLGQLILEYDDNGNLIQEVRSSGSFNTGNGSRYIQANKCFESIDAPAGYVDISHCFNGVFDPGSGEFGVDCGGTCPPCKNTSPPCAATLKNNTMQVKNGSDISQNSGFSITPGGKMQITVRFYSGEILNVDLPINSFPSSTRTFYTGSEFSDAKVKYNDGSFDFTVDDGSKLYVSPLPDDSAKLEFCSWTLSGPFSAIEVSASLGME